MCDIEYYDFCKYGYYFILGLYCYVNNTTNFRLVFVNLDEVLIYAKNYNNISKDKKTNCFGRKL